MNTDYGWNTALVMGGMLALGLATDYGWNTALVMGGMLALGLAWWGWLQSGLAFLQLGLGVC